MKSILTYLLLFFSLSNWAQPANDECTNAIALTLQPITNPVYTSGNLGGATESTPACSGTTSTDVWYSFTANSEANYIFMPSQSGLDLAFEILDACGGNSIACVDTNSTNFSESYYNNNFVIGQIYYIKVFLYNQTFTNAPFQIAVMDVPAPVNDDCINAINLPLQNISNTTYTSVNLGGATESTPACSGNISTDAWFSFTANSVGNKIYMPSHYGLDVAFEILDGCNGNSIVCIDNNGQSHSESYYNNNFIVGHTYFIKVYLVNQKVSNAVVDIAVTDIPAPTNDDCANAINLPLQPLLSVNYTSVNLGGATESTPACSGNTSTDAWYTFTPISVGNRIYMPSHYGLDVAFEILDGCNGNSIVCVDNNGQSHSESYYNNNFIVGHTYIIKVYLADQMAASAEIDIAVIDIPQPDNDDCVNATNLTIMTDDTHLTNGILGGATESLPACSGTAANDVWFSFIADATELSVKIGSEYGLDSVFEIFDACNGNSLACVDNNGLNFSESLTYQNFTIGQTYYVRVFGKNALYYNKSFGIVVYNPNASVSNDTLLKKWQISPNPTSNLLRIYFDDKANMQVILTNTSGQILLEETKCNTIDVSRLTKGVYFVNLVSDGQNFGTRKLIIE